MKDLLALEDEVMGTVSGGYNVDDLSPEDYAELQRLGGMLVELQIMSKNNDPGFSRERYLEILNQLDALDKELRAKYG
ncbi:MAG: hypothetical protein E7185_06035 [Erysipelotrichaceae bacterium]|nr:hypothetical protein [Erysipelotrichaceae bacterium]